MTRVHVVLMAMLWLGLPGYGVAQQDARSAGAAELQQTQEREPLQRAARTQLVFPSREIPKNLPAPDFVFRDPPPNYPRQSSDWQAKEQRFYFDLLSKGRFDALVVPLQVAEFGLHRATRSLMTAELNLAVGRATGWKLPDPYLVSKALGDGRRQVHPKDMYALADAIGARQVILGYVGHNGKGRMTVALRRVERPAGSAAGDWSRAGAGKGGRVADIPLPADVAPIEAFESRMPQIMAAMDLKFTDVARVRALAGPNISALGQTPGSLIAEADNPAREAYAFLLYAALTPRLMERTREVFAEKAYLALRRLAPESPEYRVLQARILLALGSRMAALRVLSGATLSDEELGVQAYANGNLPELQAVAAKEKNPLKRLLMGLQENQLARSYGLRNQKQSEAEVGKLKLPGDYWPHLVTRAFVDSESWAQFDNALIKHLMDIGYPVQGFGLEEMVKGQLALGDASKAEGTVNRSFVDHVRKLYEADPARWCCSTAPGRLGHADYLELLLSIGHDNLLRRITFYSSVQGNASGASRFASTIEPLYKGYPYYELVRALAELAQTGSAGTAEREGWLKSAYRRAYDVFYWEQGQSQIASKAIEALNATLRDDYDLRVNWYQADIPFLPYYSTWQGSSGNEATKIDTMVAALTNATDGFYTVSQLYNFYERELIPPDEEQSAALLKSIERRFNGDPQKNNLLAAVALRRGDHEAAKKYYRETAEQSPGYWPSIYRWGWVLYQEGDVSSAVGVWRTYPGFQKDSDVHRVSVANFAYDAGSLLYSAGHLDLAEAFYRISVDQKVGAASDISSATRLSLIKGDLPEAFAGMLRRARRYNDMSAYRDYLAMQHAAGHSKEAWAGYSQLLRDKPQAMDVSQWASAMVGHRRDRLTESDLVAWAQRPEYQRLGSRRDAAAEYLLRFATTDRIPSAELGDAIQKLAQPIWQLQTPDVRHVVVLHDDESTASILGPDAMGGRASLSIGMFPGAKKQRVRSNLAYFAAAYRELKLKSLPAAKAVFDEAAELYDLSAQSSFMLPYYAYVQAQTGGRQKVDQLLARMKPDQQGFNYFLARAALDVADGRKDDALKHVARARYARTETNGMSLLTQYTFGEFVELLAEQSGDVRLRDLALDWAKVFQKIEPWHAWSYAMEARLGKTAADRGKAMAMAYYLDPGSERLSRLPKHDVQQAVKLWGKAQPFVLDQHQPPGKKKDI